MEKSVPFSTQDFMPLCDRNSSITGFPFESYLFSQAMEGSRFLPNSVSCARYSDSINTI